MVIDRMTASMDYAAEYDGYWSNDARVGEVSADLAKVAQHVVQTCGLRSVLDIGSGEGLLVAELLKLGVDARGLDVSSTVVERCNSRIPGRFTCGSVLDLPFGDNAFHTIVSTDCMEHLAPADIPKALSEMYRVAERFVFLQIATTQDRDNHWHLTVEGRAWWEQRCFEAGFRKHPAYYRLNRYEHLNSEDWQIYVPLEKIPAASLEIYPLAALKEERDLHMDMLRETGTRSDAHVDRYRWASEFIRPGDSVLDAACGLGYGSYVLSMLSKGGRFLGIDGSEYAVNYADSNFGKRALIEYKCGMLPEALLALPDHSVDVVVCFETLEHVRDPRALLKEFYRILTPGGRIVASVPNDWSDETGEDPNPFHFHVYNFEKFVNELTENFEVEQLLGQTADRVKKLGAVCEWTSRPRSYINLGSDTSAGFEAEWLLGVATKSPIGASGIDYTEKAFSDAERRAGGNALAFARDYENPWIVRSLISIGLRTESTELRKKWATRVLEEADATSSDYGAALCVLAYLHCGSPLHKRPNGLLEAIDAYLNEASTANPTILRWKVSLTYVYAVLVLERGERDLAKEYLSRVTEYPVATYHATLLTKVAEATYLLGVLYLGDGNTDRARDMWLKGLAMLRAETSLYLAKPLEDLPAGFEMREVSTVVALMGRITDAVRLADKAAFQPTVVLAELGADYVARLQADTRLHAEMEAIIRDFSELRSYTRELLDGKEWLEKQWSSLQQLVLEQQSTIAELQIRPKTLLEKFADKVRCMLNKPLK